MRYFYLVLATAFGLSFAWSVAARDKAVDVPAAKSRQDDRQRQPVCAKGQRDKAGSARLRSACRKAAAGKAASAYEWIEAERGFILVKHDMTPVSFFE
ncbi:hypothetical protein [Agrobacterium sp. NPDC089420]|uniref:hypothetical protein n=1 Tax=Agrobacterium sp. NPDC089420 TaxID=3363918 RepID=UPI00384B4A8E